MAKRKSKKKAKGYLLPKYQDKGRVLQPWEYLGKDSTSIHTNLNKLPLMSKEDQESVGITANAEWMKDWISKRPHKLEELTDKHYEKFNKENPTLGWINENIFGGVDSKELSKETLDNSIEKINSLKYRDTDKIEGDSHVPYVKGQYSPWYHDISIYNPKHKQDTQVHEIGHGSKLQSNSFLKDFIKETVKNDPIYTKKYDSYYHSPGEIYSRIWEIRKGLGLDPEETITKESLKKVLRKII